MKYWHRIKNLGIGLICILFALTLVIAPSQGFYVVAMILCISLFGYAIRMLWYYFTMARHMVGGKAIVYQGIIALDLALFASSVISMSKVYIILYLLGVYAFSGAIDMLRAMEAKRFDAPSWKLKFVSGCVMVTVAAALSILGLFFGANDFLVYGYCVSLVYSAVIRIVGAFRRTSVVFIQ